VQDFVQLLLQSPGKHSPQPLQPKDVPDSSIDALLEDVEKPPQFASVLYNQPAKRHILDNRLHAKLGLDAILKQRLDSHSPKAEREVPPFPNDSIVLKMDWKLVAIASGSTHLTEPIPIENRAPHPVRPPDPQGRGSGQETMAVMDTDRKDCGDLDYDPPNSHEPVTVPMGCFYAFRIDPNSIVWKLLPGLIQPLDPRVYYLVLMAVHLTTKETPDWVWATFWWNNHSSDPNYGWDRPSPRLLKGDKWRHFLMDTTLSETTPLELDHGPRICFNPYLEARFPDSNCVHCHKRAVYSPDQQASKQTCGYEVGSAPRCSEKDNGRLPTCSKLQASCDKPIEDYFKGVLQTDFLWTIADAQNAAFQQMMERVLKRFRDLQMEHQKSPAKP
jgi:hypothetical protein